MEELASKYAVAGSEGRVVDYLLCFKTYLLDAAEKYVPSEAVMAAGRPHYTFEYTTLCDTLYPPPPLRPLYSLYLQRR